MFVSLLTAIRVCLPSLSVGWYVEAFAEWKMAIFDVRWWVYSRFINSDIGGQCEFKTKGDFYPLKIKSI